MSGHAKLSPSAASRWMTCTPSAHLEAQFPNKTSSFAEEGTLAHAICENILRLDHGQITDDEFEAIRVEHEKQIYYNDEMLEYCQNYVDFVNLSAFEDGAYVFIEQKLDMSNYIPNGFGTGDCLVIKDGVLKFFDLKYGKGVKVSAVNNSQLKIYALGALNDYGHIFDVTEVELNIYQPRIDGSSTWTTSVEELTHWAETELKEKALLAWDGKGDFNPGPACGFCRAKAQCRALKEHNMELAALAFKDPDLLDTDELVEVLEKESLFTNWINAVKEYVFSEALQGKKIPGFKLVHGRSTRVYGDPVLVENTLKEKGITNIYVEPKLVGITELTKRIGKAKFTEIVNPLLIKPAGKPALVPESDKRAEIASTTEAADVFNDDSSDLI